jgi:hypothetical protein
MPGDSYVENIGLFGYNHENGWHFLSTEAQEGGAELNGGIRTIKNMTEAVEIASRNKATKVFKW